MTLSHVLPKLILAFALAGGCAQQVLCAERPAPNTVAYFAIEADDLPRARKFYEQVFGWQFIQWGPDYFLINTGKADRPGIMGGLAPRREPRTGTGSNAFECTIAVESIAAAERRIVENGGRIDQAPSRIAGVGTLLYFIDTEGNRVGAMQYQ